jgi:trehalose 6-phosphate phosphatase
MTGVPGLLIAGNHGTEWLGPESEEPLPAPAASSLPRDLDRALGSLPEMAGMVVEHKGLSATVHYRNVHDPASALPIILEALGDTSPSGLDLRQGRMSVELRPRGLGDKGSAARTIIERFGLRGVLVMGDDITDVDMFRAVTELRSAGRLRGAIVGVGGRDETVPPPVAEASDVVLADPAAAAALLAGLART